MNTLFIIGGIGLILVIVVLYAIMRLSGWWSARENEADALEWWRKNGGAR